MENIDKFIEENFAHKDEETKERIRKFMAKKTKAITFDTTPEQNAKIAKAIDDCKHIKSRARFAEEVLGITPHSLYRKIKGIRKWTNDEIALIEQHIGIVLREA